MASSIQSGFCATRGSVTSPDMTFVWNAAPNANGETLVVTAQFGGGTAVNNNLTANIAWGSTEVFQILPSNNPAIMANGTLQVIWGDYDSNNRPQSYVVILLGGMVRANVNNITSSSMNGVLFEGAPIIVCAYLNGQTSSGSWSDLAVADEAK